MTRRRTKLVLAAIGIALFALCISAAWYLTSARFHESVRARVVEGLEQTTGGRVEMKSFEWSLSKLEFEIRDLTIHGLEGVDEVPYAHADRVFVRARVLSLFSRKVGLKYVGVERPVLHLIVYPDGSTNQPAPKVAQLGGRARAQQLFDMAINRLEVKDGRLLLNDKPIPLDLDATDVGATLTYRLLARRYDGELRAAMVQTKYTGLPPQGSQAALQFSLWPDRAELKSLKWASARSQIEASGALNDFRDLKADFTYKASLDVSELGAIERNSAFRSGRIELNGQAAYRGQGFSSAGKLILKNAEWQGDSLRVTGINAGAQFTVNPDRIALSSVFGTAFGGSANGSAEIRNWMTGRQPPAGQLKPAPEIGIANLRFNGIQVSQLAAAFATRSLPLENLGPVGAASGTLRAQWAGSSSNMETAVNLDIVPPANLAPGQLPITAHLQAVFSRPRQTIVVTQFDLATRATRAGATGVLGSATAALRVSVDSTDFSEFSPVLALFGEGAFPADIHGRASFNGTISGKLAAPSIAGRIEATDFDSLMSIPPGLVIPLSIVAPAKPVLMHWDLLRADVLYSSTQSAARHGLLRRGAAQIEFDVTANLQGARFDADTPFSLRSKVASVDIADLQALLDRRYPVAGRLSLDVNLAGTINDLRGDGHMQVASLRIGPEPFTSLRANLRFAGRETQFNDIVLAHNGARVAGSFAYVLGTRGFRFDLRGAGFDLAQFQQLQSERYRVAGLAEFKASGSGTREAPVINGSLRVSHLVVNSDEVGELTAEAVTHGADLQLNARAHYQRSELTVEGTAHMRDEWPADLVIHFDSFDIDPLLRAYLPGRITRPSAIGGRVDVKGPLREPRGLNITGTIDRFSAEIEMMPIGIEGAIRFDMADQVFNLRQLHLKAEDTNLTASGSVQLGGAREMNLNAKGDISMRLLQTLNPDLAASGHIKVKDVTVGGTMSKPAISGTLGVENAAISFRELPNGLSEVNGTLRFDQNRLAVQSLTAKTGGGTIDLKGWISYAHGVLFSFKVASVMESGASAEEAGGIRLRYPPGVSAVARVKGLVYAGSVQNSRLSGEIEITRFALNSRFDFAQYLAQTKQGQTLPEPTSPLSNLHFDVHITSSPEVQVQTTSAKLSGNVDLRLRGTANQPVLLGRVNVLEGNVSISGTKYRIERGDVTFSNPTHIEPVVNVEATARIRDYDISVGVHGVPPDKLKPTYRSDPPLPTADIIALLALGRTKEESVLTAGPTQNYTETTSNVILSEALSSTVSSRSQKLFGLSRIKIDPQAGGPESNPNARATIEQQVSDKVTLTFITNLSQSSQQIIQVEYNVNRNLTVIAIRDQNGVVSFDVRYRQRKR